MGYYINPPSETKEAFLLREGVEVTPDQAEIDPGSVPVCLVNNGAFTAAGIGYDEREVEAFKSPTDHRPKRFFMVSRDALRGYCDKL